MRLFTALFKAMQGKIDLVHACRQKRFSAQFQKRTVGGDDRLVSACARHPDKLRQLRMRQRLTHQMIVKVLRLIGELIQHARKFRRGHLLRRSPVPVTKGAIHIALIGDLHVDLAVHPVSFPECLLH